MWNVLAVGGRPESKIGEIMDPKHVNEMIDQVVELTRSYELLVVYLRTGQREALRQNGA